MTAQTIACQLYEPDGTLLSGGAAVIEQAASVWEALVTALDRPGRLVQRCLVGGVHELRLQLAGGGTLLAHLEQVAFDPKLGRTCRLRVETGEGSAPPPVGLDSQG